MAITIVSSIVVVPSMIVAYLILPSFLWFYLFAAVGFFGLATLALPAFYSLVLWEQDLKKKYGASWAIVTGGSSGSTFRARRSRRWWYVGCQQDAMVSYD